MWFSDFFESDHPPTSRLIEKLFLKENSISSDKHFALFTVVEVISQGFPWISHEYALVRFGCELIRLESLDMEFSLRKNFSIGRLVGGRSD